MVNFSKYIGIKYKHKGRNIKGADCYGLITLIYNEMLDIELSDFIDVDYEQKWYKDKKDHIVNNISKVWESVTEPYQTYDGLLFYNSPKKIVANHIGMYIGNDKFIHLEENSTSMISRLDNYWMSRLYCALRYKKEG
jgi:lipoprotein Spr